MKKTRNITHQSEQIPEAYTPITFGAQCAYLVDEMFLKEGIFSFKDVFTELIRKGGEGMRGYAKQTYLSMLAEASERYLAKMDDVQTVRAFDLNTFVEPENDSIEPTEAEEARAKRRESLLAEYGERTVEKGLLCSEAEDMHYIGMQLGPEMLKDGVLNYRSFFGEMVRVMGDRVRPLVKHIYMALKADADVDSLALMDTLEQVRAFDELSNINKLETAQTKERKLRCRELENQCKAYRKVKDADKRMFSPSQLESMIGMALILASVYLVYDIFFNLFFKNMVSIAPIFLLFIIPIAIALLLKHVLGMKITERHTPLVIFLSVLLPWLCLRSNMWMASGPIEQKTYEVFDVGEDVDDRTCTVLIRMDDNQQKRFDFTSNSGYTRDQIFGADLVELTMQKGLWGITVIKNLKLIDLENEEKDKAKATQR
jgi:hypothetical protein